MTGSGCEQLGVVRTNCIDSLDRTNVAQYIIGNRVLAMQAEALGLHSHREISTFLRVRAACHAVPSG